MAYLEGALLIDGFSIILFILNFFLFENPAIPYRLTSFFKTCFKANTEDCFFLFENPAIQYLLNSFFKTCFKANTEDCFFLLIIINSFEQFFPFIISSGKSNKKYFDLIYLWAHITA